MDSLLSLWVPGRPRTKGSLRPVINWATQTYHMEEQVRESKSWRTRVANAAIREIAIKANGKWRLKHGYPCMDAVAVSLSFVFEREGVIEGDAASAWPIDRRYGDLDKLQRNVLDALTDARVYGDDSQVAQLIDPTKRFAQTGETSGVLILVERLASAVADNGIAA